MRQVVDNAPYQVLLSAEMSVIVLMIRVKIAVYGLESSILLLNQVVFFDPVLLLLRESLCVIPLNPCLSRFRWQALICQIGL